jgi:hypothetical protein
MATKVEPTATADRNPARTAILNGESESVASGLRVPIADPLVPFIDESLLAREPGQPSCCTFSPHTRQFATGIATGANADVTGINIALVFSKCPEGFGLSRYC